jgi:hypothetical protein
MQKIMIKKAAVGLVQAIQLRFMSFSFLFLSPLAWFLQCFEGYMFFHLLVNLLIPLKSAGHKFNHEIISNCERISMSLTPHKAAG